MQDFNDQQGLRERLTKIVGNQFKPLSALAKDIGICYPVLMKFLKGKDTSRYYIYLKIRSYIDTMEKQ